VDAVNNHHIAVISDAVNRPAPRIVSAIEDLARQLHPDAFVEKPESLNEKNAKDKLEKEKDKTKRFFLCQFRLLRLSLLSSIPKYKRRVFWRLRMRPLTLRRLLLQCTVLLLILFGVVIVAIKFGAVPVSLYALARDMWGVLFHQRSGISTDYVLIIQNIRLPRILLGIIVALLSPSPAQVFRRCFAIHWRILMFSAFPAAQASAPSSR